jgi:hypothetical protein
LFLVQIKRGQAKQNLDQGIRTGGAEGWLYWDRLFRPIKRRWKLEHSNTCQWIVNSVPDPNPDKPQPKRTWLVREIPNPKFQIPNEDVSCGHILNAFGEEHTDQKIVYRILKRWTASGFTSDETRKKETLYFL